ncbi:hypothetical protein niasHT_027696 [Heterodera trifolii]|uniref:Uncharacterized protein n=1 Tax=Heterodera trifolii TaxID=157864 RepID=A0ABD2KBL7_9BILA
MPVQIAEVRPNSSVKLEMLGMRTKTVWVPYSMLKMPVITPGFPEINSTHLMNHQTEYKSSIMAINDAHQKIFCKALACLVSKKRTPKLKANNSHDGEQLQQNETTT